MLTELCGVIHSCMSSCDNHVNFMNIGDKVRFLDDVGGGKIAGFQGKDIVLVEDADGFQIPTPKSKVVVIEPAVWEEQSDSEEVSSSGMVKTAQDAAQHHADQCREEEKKKLAETVPQMKREDRVRPVAWHSLTDHTPKDAPVVIDLHAHELLETTAGMSHGDILRYQLRTMRDALEQHKNNRGQKLIFIHGKGQGVLRQAVINELKHYFPHLPFQDASFSEYGYGATQVTMR